MKIGSRAVKWLVYMALALAHLVAFGADLATPIPNATASAEFAGREQALLARAVGALSAHAGQALDAVNAFCGPYAEKDLYVFVISISHKLVLANGSDPRLIEAEADALSVRAPGGKFVREAIADAGQRDQREMDYAWPNPVTGQLENKHVVLRKVDDMVVGVGSYAQ